MNARHIQRVRQLEQPQAEELASPKREASAREATPDRKDRVVLSEKAQTFRRLQETATRIPEVRVEKVKALRAAIARGSYHVSSKAIAEKMLGGHETTHER